MVSVYIVKHSQYPHTLPVINVTRCDSVKTEKVSQTQNMVYCKLQETIETKSTYNDNSVS